MFRSYDHLQAEIYITYFNPKNISRRLQELLWLPDKLLAKCIRSSCIFLILLCTLNLRHFCRRQAIPVTGREGL
jgi:hypothetical protein